MVMGAGGTTTTDSAPDPGKGEGSLRGEGNGPTRSGYPRSRTPAEIRRVLRRLRYLAQTVRTERRERGVEFAKATTEAEAALYTALLDAEDLLVAYRQGTFRRASSTAGD